MAGLAGARTRRDRDGADGAAVGPAGTPTAAAALGGAELEAGAGLAGRALAGAGLAGAALAGAVLLGPALGAAGTVSAGALGAGTWGSGAACSAISTGGATDGKWLACLFLASMVPDAGCRSLEAGAFFDTQPAGGWARRKGGGVGATVGAGAGVAILCRSPDGDAGLAGEGAGTVGTGGVPRVVGSDRSGSAGGLATGLPKGGVEVRACADPAGLGGGAALAVGRVAGAAPADRPASLPAEATGGATRIGAALPSEEATGVAGAGAVEARGGVRGWVVAVGRAAAAGRATGCGGGAAGVGLLAWAGAAGVRLASCTAGAARLGVGAAGPAAALAASPAVGVSGSVVCRLRSALTAGSTTRAPGLRGEVGGRTGAGSTIWYEPSLQPITSGSRSDASLPATEVLMISPRR